MTALFNNNAFSTLASGISDSATSITLNSSDGAKFPSPSSPTYFFATLIDTSNNLEIVKCTARSTDTLTVVRAQESTSARAYSAGDRIEMRLTAAGLTANTDHAKDWAMKIDGTVLDSEYSAKAYAIGGTGVTDTAGKGAAKEWATETSGTVDGTSYSAKEYAAGTQASTGGSAKSWAQDTDQVNGATTNDRSAKNWAQGGSMTGATLGGSSKDWAQVTGGTVDGSEYSSKEYAVGTTATSSKTYATKVNGAVTGTDFSAKAWAIGGTGVTDTSSRGAAKEWAIEVEDNTVDGSGYSALHWATKAAASSTAATASQTASASSQTAAASSATAAAASFDSFDDRYLGAKSSNPSVDNDGDSLIAGALYFNSSSNDLRAYTGSTWISYGANSAASVSYSNSSSGLSATTAQAAIDEVEGRVDTNTASITALGTGMFTNVGNITTGTTVPHITNDDGRLYLCDTSGGNIIINLPAIGSDEGHRFGFQKTHASNTVTINRNGSDTVNGGTSYTLSAISEYILIVADDNSTDNWVVADLSPVVAGTGLSISGTTVSISNGGVDATQLASNAVTSVKINADAVTGAKIADDAINSEHYTDASIDLAHVSVGAKTEVIAIACSDETTALATATAQVTFHMPYAFYLTDVKAGLTTAPVGSVFRIDINEAGSTIFTEELTIDAGEKTSATAATAAVIGGAGPALAADALMTVDIEAVGSGTAGAGLKVYLIGYQT